MADCNNLIAGLNPNCDALNKVGGANKRVWIVQKSKLSFTVDTAGYINSLALAVIGSIPAQLFRFYGKRDKNNATWPVTAGENINTFNHIAVMSLYYSTPSDLIAIQNLVNADDVIVFMQTNDNKIIVLGSDLGLNASAGEGGTGTVLNDSTAYVVTLSGQQSIIPLYFSINGTIATIAQNTAYLDSLSAA